jgi:hypothetical protein
MTDYTKNHDKGLKLWVKKNIEIIVIVVAVLAVAAAVISMFVA